MIGKLTAIAGPMFAGKTSKLVKRILWEQHKGSNIKVFNHSSDIRYDTNHIVTHTQMKIPAILLDDINQIWLHVNATHIFIDEIHFFSDDLIQIVKSLINSGINITVSGLDQDYKGEPFRNTASMLAMADEVFKVSSYCSVCGRDATKTYKKVDNGDRLEVGSNDSYEARCLEHWK